MGMHRLTPFARLGVLTKTANTEPFPFAPQYLPGRVPLPTPGAPGVIKHPGVIDNMWGDIAVSSIPFVGSAYMANKAVGDFRNGNWGSGLGNMLFAGASLIPGVGAVRGGLSALRAGAKGISAFNKTRAVAGGALRGGMAATPGGLKTTTGVGVAGMAASMLDPSRPPEQQAAAAPVAAPPSNDFITNATNSIRSSGLSTQ
jgi:hypothetical protein